MLIRLMSFHGSLKLSSFFKIIFFFLLLCFGEFHCCLPDHWFFLLVHLGCCWFPLVSFSLQFVYSSALYFPLGTFLCFLSVEVFTIFIHSSPEWWASLWLLLWTLFQVNCLSLLVKVFSGFLSCSLVWNIFLCLVLLDSLCLFLFIRWNSYISQSWRNCLV